MTDTKPTDKWSGIRYVIVSDLHLGALNSVLNDVAEPKREDGKRAPKGKYDVELTDVARELATLLGSFIEQGATLVLNGDIVELGRIDLAVSIDAFEMFVKCVESRCGGKPPTIYLPGNHDHTMWQGAKLNLHAARLLKEKKKEAVKAAAAASGTSESRAASDSTAVDSSLKPVKVEYRQASAMGCKDTEPLADLRLLRNALPTVRMRYPVAYLDDINPGLDRAVLVHHGHFLEPTYLVPSQLISSVFGIQPIRPRRLWQYEEQNGAWIDFVWSGLGQAGEMGRAAGLLYELFSGPHSSEMAELLGQRVVGWAGRRTRVPAPVLRWIGRRVGAHVLDLDLLERGDMRVTLSKEAHHLLDEFLAGPVHEQFYTETKAEPPRHVSFVFGHTHKPMAMSRRVAGYEEPVHVYNTGGWTVDRSVPEPLKGANLVVVDNFGNVAMIRLFSQDPRADLTEVITLGRKGSIACVALEALLHNHRGTLDALRKAVDTAVRTRRDLLRERAKDTMAVLREAAKVDD